MRPTSAPTLPSIQGLKKTLAAMDAEAPRSANSISSRSDLARALTLEKLCRRNKESEAPLRSMLEVMAKYFADKGRKSESAEAAGSGSTSSAGSSRERRPESAPARRVPSSSAGDAAARPSRSRTKVVAKSADDDDDDGDAGFARRDRSGPKSSSGFGGSSRSASSSMRSGPVLSAHNPHSR